MILRRAIILILLGLAFFTHPVRAANVITDPLQAAQKPITITPEVPIPGVYTGQQTIDNNGIARYIRAIYVYFIWTVGILAVVMIMFGGISWIAAAGNAGRINDARETINNAIIGLIIALTSYALLYVINPELLNLSLPPVGSLTNESIAGLPIVDFCDPANHLDCGSVGKLGSAFDKNGKAVDVFCAGTICPSDSLCQLNQAAVPVADQLTTSKTGFSTTYTSYYPAVGCQKTVQVDNPAGIYTTSGPLKVAFDTTFNLTTFGGSLNCGRAYGNIDILGNNCDTSDAALNTKSICIMIGAKAKLQTTTGNNDKVSNTQCTP